MTLSEEIVSAAVSLSYEDIPTSTVERAKLFLMDTVGVGLAGINAGGITGVWELIDELAGAPEAKIFGRSQKVSAPQAALANSLMAHSRDFDDLYEAGGTHVNITVVPAVLAAAQKMGNVNGKQCLSALIIGVDLICRLSIAVPLFRGWHVSSTFGVFGAAVSAGFVLGLNPSELTNALGLAYSRASGTRQGRLEGTLAKRLQPALACESGVMCALMAQKGLTGPKQWLEGMWGISRVYSQNHNDLTQDSVQALRNGLGHCLLGDDLSLKLYPCCKVAHTSIEAALFLAKEYNLRAEQIKKVEVWVSQGAYDTVGHPFKIRTNPQVDAQFSIPYTVALALTDGQVTLSGFETERIHDPHLHSLAEKVSVFVDSEIQDYAANMVNLSTKMKIYTHRGQIFEKELDKCRGTPENPASEEEIIEKFTECARYSGSFSESRIKSAVDLILNIEKNENIDNIMNLL